MSRDRMRGTKPVETRSTAARETRSRTERARNAPTSGARLDATRSDASHDALTIPVMAPAPIQRRIDPTAVVQRNPEPGGGEPDTDTDDEQEPEAPGAQLKADPGATPVADAYADVPVASTGGSPLPESVATSMGAALGHDFSGVRIHEGSEAKRLGAIAYTRGANIHFQPGRYDPGSDAGRHLLAHELTHVVQQAAGRVPTPSGKGAPINDDATLEREAEDASRSLGV